MRRQPVIAVLEDQRAIARPWLRDFRRHSLGEAPDEHLFVAAEAALEWVLQNSARPWFLVVDIDLGDDVLSGSLAQERELLAQEEPALARFQGAVLLRHLIRLEAGNRLGNVRHHILVVTAQAFTVLARWLEHNGIDVIRKPVLVRELRDEVSDRLARLKGVGDDGKE